MGKQKKEMNVGAQGAYLSYDELAEKKNLTPSFIKKAKQKMGLPFFKFGALVKFLESDFDKWAESRKQQAS